MKLKLCTYPGCDCLVEEGSRCPKHMREHKGGFSGRRTKSREWNSLYHSATWRRIRLEFLFKNPFCVKCGDPAKIVDHIIPHRGQESLFYDETNLQSLCWKCHSAKTLAENDYFKDRK